MSNSQLENLISQVVDGDASSSQWKELNELANNDPQIWCELANTLRDHQSFSRAVNANIAQANSIPLPENIVEPSYDLSPENHKLMPRRLGHWGGWAVAAMIAIAWAGGFERPNTNGIQNNEAGLTAAQYLDKYKEQGRKEGFLYDELPDKVILDSKQAESGKGFEILYVRQIVEKAFVLDLRQISSLDEQGRPILVPVTNIASGGSSRYNNQ